MENIALAVGFIVVWAICATCFYVVAIKKWLPKFDDMTLDERKKLFQTRTQRYLNSVKKKKR